MRRQHNGRFRKMAALPRVDSYFLIFAAVSRVERLLGSRHFAKPQDVGRKLDSASGQLLEKLKIS
jgi:hypothetical protein